MATLLAFWDTNHRKYPCFQTWLCEVADRQRRKQAAFRHRKLVASLDQKIEFSEKTSVGASVVGDKVREVDQEFYVSEKTKSAFAVAVADQNVSSAGSAIMKNRYILTGTSWVTGAFGKVAKATEEVGQKTKEKMVMVEEE